MRADEDLRSAFTLVEMAVVLVIVGLLMMASLPALMGIKTASQRSLSQTNLQSLMQATAAYVQGNGCLPCPTPANIANSATAGFGHVRGDSSSSPAACGSCAVPEGIPPFGSLGIPAADAKDAWGHWITMRVDPALTINFGIAPPFAPCLSTDLPPNTVTPSCVTLGASQKGLCRSNLSSASRITVQTPAGTSPPSVQQAAVIFVSHGVSGAGSFFALPVFSNSNGQRLSYPPTMPGCSTAGGYARCNGDGNAVYVNAPLVQTGNDPFDQILIFADRNTLVSQFNNGSCQTVW